MNPDQAAPSLKCTCVYAVDIKSRQNFWDKNIGGLYIVYKSNTRSYMAKSNAYPAIFSYIYIFKASLL